MHRPFHLIILGCGLAGAALAWQAHRRGIRVSIVDRNRDDTCSHVAAGLVTPITGSRAATSWRWESFFPEATSLYQWVEHQTGATFWHQAPALRVFQSEAERTVFQNRWSDSPRASNSVEPFVNFQCQLDHPAIRSPFGVCEMSPAARLDTKRYLFATREYFQSEEAYHVATIDCEKEVSYLHGAEIDILGLHGDSIAFCQGFEARHNSMFRELPLHPARGDILTLELPSNVSLTQVIHHSAWFVPVNQRTIRVGATYDRVTLDSLVDGRDAVRNARLELLDRCNALFQFEGDVSVSEHLAAVRPASYDRHPLIGRHPTIPVAYCVNGLGSKGSLMAPFLANALLDQMEGKLLDPSLDWQRRQSTFRR